MKKVILLAFGVAIVFHVAILGFGGLLFNHGKAEKVVREDVDLVAGEEKKDDKKDEPKPEEKAEAKEAEEAIEQESPVAPDLRDLQALEAPSAPALAAMSLSDLESALGGGMGAGGGDGFGGAGGPGLASGGRIGGTGSAEGGGSSLDDMLTAAQLDQRPRPIFQASPQYPVELRRQKIEGTVNVVFYVDKDGKVTNPQVENSTHPAFERPALEAVRQWRFDPGTRKGEKVSFKMRIPISFHVS